MNAIRNHGSQASCAAICGSWLWTGRCRPSERFQANGLPFAGRQHVKMKGWNRGTPAGASQGASFPFQFAIGRNDVPRAVVVEQLPLRLLASSGLPCRLGQGNALGDELAQLLDEFIEVVLLFIDSAAPIADNGPVPRDDVFGMNPFQFGQIGEKAADTAVDDGQVLDKQEITGE